MYVREDGDELVAAHPGHRIRGAEDRPEPGREGYQGAVAARWPKRSLMGLKLSRSM